MDIEKLKPCFMMEKYNIKTRNRPLNILIFIQNIQVMISQIPVIYLWQRESFNMTNGSPITLLE